MGKRKHPRETLEELIERPWCYYCDRHFDDVTVLVDHQRHKHFQCTTSSCNRRLNTAGGLRVHLSQVHKEELPEVPNALEGRGDPSVEIFAMEGIPQELIDTRRAMTVREFRKMESEHYLRTGNPLPGTGGHQTSKRKKVETKQEMMARLEAFKAKRKAEKAAAAAGASVPSTGTSSAAATPIGNAHPFAAPGAPSAIPPQASVPHFDTASASYGANPVNAWNPTMPFLPYPDATTFSFPPRPVLSPAVQQAFDTKSSSAVLPLRPMPANQLPNRPDIPTEPEFSAQADLESLMDQVQAQLARSKEGHKASQEADVGGTYIEQRDQAAVDKTAPMTPVEMLMSGAFSARGIAPVARGVAPKNNKKEKDTAATGNATVGSRVSQMLHSDVDSFEELKAARYDFPLPLRTTTSTQMATQGVTGPVEDGASDVQTR